VKELATRALRAPAQEVVVASGREKVLAVVVESAPAPAADQERIIRRL
jgi:hypothetical protein